MTVKYRRPITDVHNRDFVTGEVLPQMPLTEGTQKQLTKSKKNWEAKVASAVNGQVYIEGLGYVTL